MKNFVPFFAVMCLVLPAWAIAPGGQHSRPSVNSQMIDNTPRQAISPNQVAAMASMPTYGNSITGTENLPSGPDGRGHGVVPPVPGPSEPTVDSREKERNACLSNNIGVGNTFVWASRFSNTGNYSSMMEDTENPENNACFVKVALKSSDSSFTVSDIPERYYEMGKNIVCGSWADEGMIEKRILSAKKSGRTWGTVGASVGGAAVGVGSMELFGNRLIGGKVEGQKYFKRHGLDNELIRSQLLVARDKNKRLYRSFMDEMQALRIECESDVWKDTEKPAECRDIDYDYFLSIDSGKKID